MGKSRKKICYGGNCCASEKSIREWKKSSSRQYRRIAKLRIDSYYKALDTDECSAVLSNKHKESSDPYGPMDGKRFFGTENEAKRDGWFEFYEKEMRK